MLGVLGAVSRLSDRETAALSSSSMVDRLWGDRNDGKGEASTSLLVDGSRTFWTSTLSGSSSLLARTKYLGGPCRERMNRRKIKTHAPAVALPPTRPPVDGVALASAASRKISVVGGAELIEVDGACVEEVGVSLEGSASRSAGGVECVVRRDGIKLGCISG